MNYFKKSLVISLFFLSIAFFGCKESTDSNTNPTPEPVEPIAYYPFNGNTNDGSGNQNHGMVNGATLISDRFGNDNSAYNFDGADDYISLGTTALLSTEIISITAWIKIDSLAWDWMDILSYGSGGHVLAVDELGHLIGGIQFSFSCEFESPTELVINEWYFVTLTRNANHLVKLFVNTIEEVSDTCTFSPIYGDSINIGRDPYGGEYFRGAIDEVRIYNKALTREEIQTIYNIGN